MPVVDISKQPENNQLIITAEFAAPVERVWQVYADPRQLEKVWGPPGYPATVVEHELAPGGRVHYFMTGPEGEKFPGYWRVTAVEELRSIEFFDGFADTDFNPVETMPESRNVYSFTPTEQGTKVVYSAVYESAEALRQVLEMGMEEGSREAINQIDELLAA